MSILEFSVVVAYSLNWLSVYRPAASCIPNADRRVSVSKFKRADGLNPAPSD